MSSAPEFDPVRILSELDQAGVRYVLIGGVAGTMFGSSVLTFDLDICYARDAANLEALVGVLRELGATLRGVEPGLPFRLDATTIARGDAFTFSTDAGDFDILGVPSGTGGYEDLVGRAARMPVAGFTVLAASIDDLIRMKQAAGRPKDLFQLEVLAALREEINKGGG
jgi:hypothetical protein